MAAYTRSLRMAQRADGAPPWRKGKAGRFSTACKAHSPFDKNYTDSD
jgi:hypothetical protein